MDTILLRDPSGKPISGLNPTTVLNYAGFPALPAAEYTGDGFGGAGQGGVRMSMDPEGLVLDTQDNDGGFWISDEYGPYVYKFDKTGKMDMAVRPPDAYIPMRNGVQRYVVKHLTALKIPWILTKFVYSFATDNPPIYNQNLHPVPVNPTSGRSNNQGFEGLTVSGDGKDLYVLLQSAMIQDGGLDRTTNRYSRMLKYDISNKNKAKLSQEYVVPLPQYIDVSDLGKIISMPFYIYTDPTLLHSPPRNPVASPALLLNPRSTPSAITNSSFFLATAASAGAQALQLLNTAKSTSLTLVLQATSSLVISKPSPPPPPLVLSCPTSPQHNIVPS